jgi:hypothetical protein
LTPNAFTINIINNGNVIASFLGSNTVGYTMKLPSGTFSVVEDNPQGYVAKFTGTCSGTATFGQAFTCNINDCDQPSFLTVITNVIGGSATPSEFVMNITNSAEPSPFPGSLSGTQIELAPGNFMVSELVGGPAGYSANYSAGCSGTLAMGQSGTCVVNNYDTNNALIVTKIVNNKYGGTATASAFTMNVYSNSVLVASSIPGNSQGTVVPIPVGPYSVTESSLTGYSQVSAVGCTGTISYGQAMVCTITNNGTRPQLTISPSNVVLDSGEYETYTLTVTGGAGPFTVELYNITGGKQVGSSVLIPTAGGSNTVTFQSKATGTFAYNGIAAQGAYKFNSTSNTIVVNPSLVPPTITVAGSKYDQGESVTLASSMAAGGTPPYVYTFVITNSNTMQTFYACTDINNNFCTFSATQLGPFFANVIVTDSAYPTPGSVNSLNSADFVVNPDFNLIGNHYASIAVNTVTLSLGGSVLITANDVLGGGSAPYTYTFSVFNALSNQQIGSNIVNISTSLANSIAYTPPSNGLYYATVGIKDSATPGEVMPSAPSLVFLVGSVASPTALIQPNKPVYDSGQTVVYTIQVFGGVGPFNVELYNVTGVKQQGTNVIIQAPDGSNTIAFPAYSLISSQQFTFNAMVYDQTTHLSFGSPSNTITVNPPEGSLVTIVPKMVDAGQIAVFDAIISGGTPPYSFTFNVYNSSDALIYTDSIYGVPATNPLNTAVPTSASITFTSTPDSIGTDNVDVILTDSYNVSEPLPTNTLTVNPPAIFFNSTVDNTTGSTDLVHVSVQASNTAAPSGSTILKTLDITFGSLPSINVTMTYSCSIPSSDVSPYKLINGTWTPITPFTVNSAACTVNFILNSDPIVSLMQYTPSTPTTSTPTTSTGTGTTTSATGSVTSSGGSSGPQGPIVTSFSQGGASCYQIANFTSPNSKIIVLGGTSFTVTDSAVMFNSTALIINNSTYTLPLNKSVSIGSNSDFNFTAELVSVSYLPILHTVTVDICAMPLQASAAPTATQPNATATVPASTTTTIVPTTTTAPATTVPPTKGTSPSVPTVVPVTVGIAVAIAIGLTYYNSRKRTRKRKK